MFGLDRFYLGYPGIGLAKLCTLGFMFLGQLLDIILIAAQVCDVLFYGFAAGKQNTNLQYNTKCGYLQHL